jgi:hypothetical protein
LADRHPPLAVPVDAASAGSLFLTLLFLENSISC